jgi:hypothetical protein
MLPRSEPTTVWTHSPRASISGPSSTATNSLSPAQPRRCHPATDRGEAVSHTGELVGGTVRPSADGSHRSQSPAARRIPEWRAELGRVTYRARAWLAAPLPEHCLLGPARADHATANV